MSKWFPNVTEAEGLEAARKGGVFGAVAFAVMLGIGVVLLLATGRTPDLQQAGGNITGALIGIVIEAALVLFAAWRFKVGKGAFWGSAVLVLFVVEIIGKIVGGSTNVGWFVAYAAIFMALLNGVRGAWARRNWSGVDVDVFE
jgi:hypothetical protein